MQCTCFSGYVQIANGGYLASRVVDDPFARDLGILPNTDFQIKTTNEQRKHGLMSVSKLTDCFPT